MADRKNHFIPILSSDEMVVGQQYIRACCFGNPPHLSLKILTVKGPCVSKRYNTDQGPRHADEMKICYQDRQTSGELSIADNNMNGKGGYNDHTVWPVEAREYLESLNKRGEEGVTEYLAILAEHGMGVSANQSA